ncbi:hypothetical protein PIB30_092390 [Stylosanthes scabra]|uniref:Uncharacterized protein n=1 Tax=Stylosanthes scabra TaxID=79078 RepID=A0ABU6VWN4_9FABA|nr:hypothetical protein [Stylosanthes scabra]
MCDDDDVEGKKASEEDPERVDDVKGIEEEGNNNNNNKMTPPRRRCLLFLVLWMWMPTRTMYSTWRSFSVTPSTPPSIVVRRLVNIPPTMRNLCLLMPTVSPFMTFPVFGHLQLVRVNRVSYQLLDNKRLRLLAFFILSRTRDSGQWLQRLVRDKELFLGWAKSDARSRRVVMIDDERRLMMIVRSGCAVKQGSDVAEKGRGEEKNNDRERRSDLE